MFSSQNTLGYVAALCVWPTFVLEAKKHLGNNSPVKIATVVNFPAGDEPLELTCASIDEAVNNGADEIDYVLPYTDLISGNIDQVVSAVKTVRHQIPDKLKLKVILETGVLESRDLSRTAANIAIDQGANFIKTSTGKVSINATEAAAIIILDVIADSHRDVGFKAAGGIKTIEDANLYLNLSAERFGQSWADSAHFRFGASGLLQDALIKLEVELSSTDNNGD